MRTKALFNGRRENGSVRSTFMEAATVVTAIASYIAGIATDWVKGWSVRWFSAYGLRKAIRVEIQALLVILNLYMLKAMDAESRDDPGILAEYFHGSPQLQSFTYYWEQRRDLILGLPEWSRLKNWNDCLASIGKGPHPPLFTAIMLFEQLTIPPLNHCCSRDTMGFVKRVLSNTALGEYRAAYMQEFVAKKRRQD